jgi:rubrerythrin
MRYRTWAAKAEEEGFPNVARLFRAIGCAEEVHANNHFRELREQAGAFQVVAGAGFGLGATSGNLQGAIEGECFEIHEMYPVYLHAAEFQKEKGAQRSFRYALAAEKIHAEMYRRAKACVEAGKDLPLGPVQICLVCGHTVEGETPDKCPVCGAPRKKFRAFA